MMTELDCRILTRACGLCWHEIKPIADAIDVLACTKCDKYFTVYDVDWGVHPTFTTPDDWEMVRIKVVEPFVYEFEVVIYDNGISWWLMKTPEEASQTVVDIIKSRPDLFPWVGEMEEE